MNLIYRIEDWPPYQHIMRLRDGLLASWVETLRRGWKDQREADLAFTIFSEYRRSLAALVDYSRAWGLNPLACYQFSDVDRDADHPYFEQLCGQLVGFIEFCAEDVKSQWRLIGGEDGKGVNPRQYGIRKFIGDNPYYSRAPRHYWEPFLLTVNVFNMLPQWYELMKKWGHHTDDEVAAWHFLCIELGEVLSRLSVRAQTFGLNPEPIYEFQRFGNPKTLGEIREAMGKLTDFIHQFENMAQAKYEIQTALDGFPPDQLYPVRRPERQAAPAPSAPERPAIKPDPISTAIGLKTLHPDWADKKIAEHAGCHASTLTRSERYQRVKQAFVADPPAMGKKNGETGDLESWEEPDDDD